MATDQLVPLTDPAYKAYVAQQMRQQHPELSKASDDEVLQAVRSVDVPNATDDEWMQVVNKVHPAPPTLVDKPRLNIPTSALIAGAAGLALGAAGTALHLRGRVAEEAPKVGDFTSALPSEVPPQLIDTIKKVAQPMREAKGLPTPPEVAPTGLPILPVKTREVGLQQPVSSPVVSELPVQGLPPAGTTPEPQPFVPSTRANQVLDPVHAEIISRLEKDPDYLSRLEMSGGGKRVTHEETWTKALASPPMTVDELANWKAGTPVNEVDIARAGLLRVYWLDTLGDAMKINDAPTVQLAYETLSRIEPGYNNMTSTPGRATEFQSVFGLAKEVSTKISELRAVNASADQVQRELRPLMNAIERANEETGNRFINLFHDIETYATGAKLSSPMTTDMKINSDAFSWFIRGMTKTISSAVSQIEGNPEDAAASLKYAFGTMQGFKDGLRSFFRAYQDLTPEERGILAGDVPLPQPDSPPLKQFGAVKAIKSAARQVPQLRVLSPFRALRGVTDAWYSVVYNAEMNTRAYSQALKEGFSGDEAIARTRQLYENPPETWKKQSDEIAKYYTGQEKSDKLLRWIQRAQSFPGMRLVIPVVKFPYNLTRMGIRLSPLGAFSPRFIRDIREGGVPRADALGRYLTGLGLMYASLAMVNGGQINGAYPRSPEERTLWKQTNRQPWSIKIGDHYVKFSKAQPLGFFLSQIAAIHEALRDNKYDKAGSIADKLLYQWRHGAFDTPFMDGMGSLMDWAEDPARNTEKFLQSTATGFIPNALRDLRNQWDPTVRQPRSIKEALQNMFPEASEKVPASIRPLGGEVQELEKSRILRATKQISPAHDDEKTALMEKLGWAPEQPTSRFIYHHPEFGPQIAELTPELRESFNRDMSIAADRAVTEAMADPKFKQLNDYQQGQFLTSLVKKVQAPIRRIYEIKSGVYDKFVDDPQKLQSETDKAYAKLKEKL